MPDDKVTQHIMQMLRNSSGFAFISASNDAIPTGECVVVGLPIDVLLDAWINSCRQKKMTPIEIQNKFNKQMLQILMIPPVNASNISNN